MLKRKTLQSIFKIKNFYGSLSLLLRSPVFWFVSFWGNFFTIAGAMTIHFLEYQQNPVAQDFLNCLVWSFSIVTTVGTGQLIPVTTAGKVFSIFMMMGGAIFLWSYMALFIGTLVEPELELIEKDLREIKKDQKWPL